MSLSSNNKRIAKNTLALYIRNLLALLVSLATVNYVLRELGNDDYGLYGVIGGVLSFVTFIGGALRISSQRFFSYEIGLNNEDRLKSLFSTVLTLYILFAVLILVFGESVGLWYINNKLIVLPSRLPAANVLFQLVIISSLVSIVFAPFSMMITAYEDMHVFGWTAVFEAVGKIVVVILLIHSPFDKLLTYSYLLALISTLPNLFYYWYAKKNYPLISWKMNFRIKDYKEIFSFSVWNLFGNLAHMTKNQGVALLLNSFFGTTINAAHGIAMTVRTTAGTLSQNFSSAINPQITKQYAVNKTESLTRLVFRGSNMSFLLMLVVVAPAVFYTDYILKIWLSNPAPHTVMFCRLLMIETLIDSLSFPLAAANQATGHIALYQALIGVFGILNLPIGYLCLKLGLAPEAVFWAGVLLQFFIVGIRIVFLRRVFPNAIYGMLKEVITPCVIVTGVAVGSWYIININVETIWSLLGASASIIIVSILAAWITMLTRNERSRAITYIKQLVANKH